MNERPVLRSVLILLPLLATQLGIAFQLRKLPSQSKWRVRAEYAIYSLVAIAIVQNLIEDISFYTYRLPSGLAKPFSITEGVVFLWMFCCLPAYLIYLTCRWLQRRLPQPVSPTRRAVLQTAAVVAVASPFAVMAYGVVRGRLDFQVREVSLPVPNLHPDLEGLRILHISDVHLGEYLSVRDFDRVVDMSNGLRPHLAIMTGDLITKPEDPMEECVRQLARIRAEAGMIGCLGNHEMYSRLEARVKTEAARRGIPFLRQENRDLRFGGARLNVAGVDYQRVSSRRLYLQGAKDLVVPGSLNLLLSHNPDVFPVAAEQGWDLTLSGHTHGGQVTLEIVEQTVNVCRFFTPFVAGEYHLGNAGCYVTRGIGTVGVPARIGVRPEITLLRLRKA